jgi:uroporphyrinogen-III synthase
MRILVLRPLDDAERSASAIAARGNEPVVAPLFEVARLQEAAPPGEFDALVLASGNAVPALADGPAAWRSLPLFAVGARTAAKAREAGFEDARSADGDRDDLIELVKSNLQPPARLLLVLARDRREDLPARLGEAGFEVTIWTAYAAHAAETLPEAAAAPLREGTIDAVLHYSARGAQTYLRLARLAELGDEALAPTHVTLSADVAGPLIEAGAGTVLVAEHPEEAAMLAALDEISKRHQKADGPVDEAHVGAGAPQRGPGGRFRSSRRTPPTLEGSAQDTTPAAEASAQPDSAPAIEAIAPSEALPQEFVAPEPPPEASSADAEPETAARHSFAPEPAARPRVPWVALAASGLIGGVIGAGLVGYALSRTAPSVDPAELARLQSLIDALQGAATALDRKAATASEAASKAGAEAQANAARLAELANAQRAENPDAQAIAGLSAQAQRAEATANSLAQRLDQAAARIGSVETLARTAAAPSAQSLAAARIVLAERVQGALAGGKPFAADLTALGKGGAPDEQMAALAAVAANGAPTQTALLAQFRAQRTMFQRELTPADASWQDRLLGLASRIVTIRPVGDTGANDPATLLIRMENAIVAGDIVAAAGLWGQLPEPARRGSAALGENLQKRAAADAAIAKIAQDAVAALGVAG